jgi:HlyD family secretion protein
LNSIFKLIAAALGLGILTVIVGANARRDHDFFSFRWKLRDDPPLDVVLATAGHERIVHLIEAPGDVEADIEVEVSSQVVGRIVRLPVREGDQVKKGDLLAQLDSVDFEAQVRSVEARLQRLRANIELTKADIGKSQRDLERNRKLFQSKVVGAQFVEDLEVALRKDEARLAMTQADLLEAEALLVKAKEDLLDTTIRSPIDGVVSKLTAEEGEVVVIGTMNNPGTVLMVISDPKRKVVVARVDESDVPKVRPGQKVRIHLQYDEGVTLTGTVERITPKGDKSTNTAAAALQSSNSNEVATFETRIVMNSPPAEVRFGMTANVEIEVDERDGALVIPSQAVLHRRPSDLPRVLAEEATARSAGQRGIDDPAKRYHQVVFVVDGGIARCRLIATGISDDTRVEVREGLRDRERVVIGPYRIFEKLKDGRAVRPLQREN